MFQHIHTGEFLHENHHMLYVHLKEELPDCLTAEAFFCSEVGILAENSNSPCSGFMEYCSTKYVINECSNCAGGITGISFSLIHV